jgi:hypothetical protein
MEAINSMLPTATELGPRLLGGLPEGNFSHVAIRATGMGFNIGAGNFEHLRISS